MMKSGAVIFEKMVMNGLLSLGMFMLLRLLLFTKEPVRDS